jgi:hypothetical protein
MTTREQRFVVKVTGLTEWIEAEILWTVLFEVFEPALVPAELVPAGRAGRENVDDAAPGVGVGPETHADHPAQRPLLGFTSGKRKPARASGLLICSMGPEGFEPPID